MGYKKAEVTSERIMNFQPIVMHNETIFLIIIFSPFPINWGNLKISSP